MRWPRFGMNGFSLTIAVSRDEQVSVAERKGAARLSNDTKSRGSRGNRPGVPDSECKSYVLRVLGFLDRGLNSEQDASRKLSRCQRQHGQNFAFGQEAGLISKKDFEFLDTRCF